MTDITELELVRKWAIEARTADQLVKNFTDAVALGQIDKYTTPEYRDLLIRTLPILAGKIIKHYEFNPDFSVMMTPVNLLEITEGKLQPVCAKAKMLRTRVSEPCSPELLAECLFFNLVEIFAEYLYLRNCKVSLFQAATPLGLVEDPNTNIQRMGFCTRFAVYSKDGR